MARRWEHHLRICVSAYLRANKITQKTRNNTDQHLKIRVPAGSNAYLCICVFSKEITALPSLRVRSAAPIS